MKKYAIIVAGGTGSRMGSDIPKQFIKVGKLPILMHTILLFFEYDKAIEIILVLPESQFGLWKELCEEYDFEVAHKVVSGGYSRFQSVSYGLMAISETEGLVAIHDGVRPFVAKEIIANSFEVASEKSNAITAVKLKDSIRRMENDGSNRAFDRSKFYLIQTPQTFQLKLIKKAFEAKESPDFTDDATVLEAMGEKVNLIEGSYMNIKITTPEDLIFANAIQLSVIFNH
jgi:2-C-methyl-D-erythritol 4-phosphate cytidylyltransferase